MTPRTLLPHGDPARETWAWLTTLILRIGCEQYAAYEDAAKRRLLDTLICEVCEVREARERETQWHGWLRLCDGCAASEPDPQA